MASKTEIINVALLELGETPIDSPDDTSSHAEFMRRIYSVTKKSILRSHPWKCARRFVTLTQLADPEKGTWDYAYALPTDFLRLHRIDQETSIYFPNELHSYAYHGEAPADWQVTGKMLLANFNPCKIEYIAEIADGDLDAELTDVLALKLATRAAVSISGSNTLKKQIEETYAQKLMEAKSTDGFESSPEVMNNNRLLAVRNY